MTQAELNAVWAFTGAAYRPASQITDPAAAQVCSETRAALDNALVNMLMGDLPDVLYLGTYDADPTGPVHEALQMNDRIHIDPYIWSQATTAGPDQVAWQRALTLLLLHEFRHMPQFGDAHPNANLWFKTHPGPHTLSQIQTAYANDTPFNILHSTTPSKMCVFNY